MAFRQFELKNYANLGQLVKQWAQKPETRPKSPQELATQMGSAGVEADFDPTKFKELRFIDIAEGVLAIRLPSIKMVEDSENRLEAEDYPIPEFYEDVFHDALVIPEIPNRKAFHLARIGEYTVQFCA